MTSEAYNFGVSEWKQAVKPYDVGFPISVSTDMYN